MNKLTCPGCKGSKWKVLETRQQPEAVLRIRECKSCEQRFESTEKLTGLRSYIK